MGGRFEEHLEMHAFLDRTKDAYVQVGHRFLLHNSDLAVAILARRFADGPGSAVLIRHHLLDDLNRDVVPIDAWLSEMQRELLPRLKDGRYAGIAPDELGDLLSKRFGLAPSILIREICHFLALSVAPIGQAPGWARRIALRNSMGPWLVEAYFGVLLEVEGLDGVMRLIGTREIAEMAIAAELGGIPPYAMIARSIKLRPWMAGGKNDQ
jgi:hypothetical protein